MPNRAVPAERRGSVRPSPMEVSAGPEVSRPAPAAGRRLRGCERWWCCRPIRRPRTSTRCYAASVTTCPTPTSKRGRPTPGVGAWTARGSSSPRRCATSGASTSRDAAIETADIALMTDDIGKVPWLIGHSRRAMSIIRQNIGISLATKAVFVVATAFGMASMWGAIAADVGVSLLVVANALRLLNGQQEEASPTDGESVGERMASRALMHGH